MQITETDKFTWLKRIDSEPHGNAETKQKYVSSVLAKINTPRTHLLSDELM